MHQGKHFHFSSPSVEKLTTMGKEEEKDELYTLMGGFGRWQAFILIGLGAVVPAVNTLQILVMIFFTPSVDFMCMPDIEEADNAVNTADFEYHDWLNFSRSLKGNESFLPSQCNATRYVPASGSFVTTENACEKWIYDKSFYPRTLVTDFDLVCGRSYLVSISQSIAMLGGLPGVFIFGILSDM